MRLILVLLALTACKESAQLYEDTQKVDETKVLLDEINVAIAMYRMSNKHVPKTISKMYNGRPTPKDGWGRDFEYVRPGPGTHKWDVISLGADGEPGGLGVNADLKTSDL